MAVRRKFNWKKVLKFAGFALAFLVAKSLLYPSLKKLQGSNWEVGGTQYAGQALNISRSGLTYKIGDGYEGTYFMGAITTNKRNGAPDPQKVWSIV